MRENQNEQLKQLVSLLNDIDGLNNYITLNYILGDMSLYSICVIAVIDAILQVRIELKTFCVLNYQLSQKFRLCLVTIFVFYFQKLVFGNRKCGV